MNAQLSDRANVSLQKDWATWDGLRLVDTATAAEILGAEPATLVIWRCTRKVDLPYAKIGRLVRYDVRDLIEFIERQKVRRTNPGMPARRVRQTKVVA